MQLGEPIESSGPRLLPRDIKGHLLLVWATDYVAHNPTVNTKPGDRADVIVVDVVDLDQVDPETSTAGLLARNSWWRQSRLIGELRGRIGNPDPVLVRIEIGAATRGIPPFILKSQTSDPQSVARANAWFLAHSDFTPSPPGGGPMDALPDQRQVTAEELPSYPGAREPIIQERRQETTLERLARQSQEGVARLPPHRPAPSGYEDEPPF